MFSQPAGRRVAIVPMNAGSAIAAGDEGVWALDGEGPRVLEIDPRTNEVGQTIELGADDLTGLTVGDGSVWATDLDTGSLWRIDPGPDPITRTIDVGFGVTAVAYGGGAVWVTNFVRDEVVRVDARTNTSRLPTRRPGCRSPAHRGERPSLPPPAAPSRTAPRVRTSSSRPIYPFRPGTSYPS